MSTQGLVTGTAGKALGVGACLGLVDTVFTYLAGDAPLQDVLFIATVPVVGLLVVSLAVLGVARSGRSARPMAWVEAALLLSPVLAYGTRGCVIGCGLDATNLVLRWLPTVLLVSLLSAMLWVRRRGPEMPLHWLLLLAGATQLSSALSFGLRTDQYPSFTRDRVLAGALTVIVVLAVAGLRRVHGRGPVALAGLCGGAAAAFAWALAATPPRLPSASGPRGGRGNRPNVVLIVLDTVRFDHLSAYGYRRRTSPELERLAADSLVFEGARADATYSLSSHASLFTGLLPSRHGAHQMGPHAATLNQAARHYRLRSDVPTLAEQLRGLGYSTGGLSANDIFLARWTGLQRGFDNFVAKARRRYLFYPLASPLVARVLRFMGIDQASFFQDTWRADTMADAAIAWLETPREPFFLFINFFDAHTPYDPPGGGPFRDDGLMGGDSLIAAYDGEIAFVDRHVGRVLDWLRTRGLLEQSLVVITADHGEYLGEKGLHFHGNPALYEPVIRVPLIVHFPERSRVGRTSRPTGLFEIAPFIRGFVDGQADSTLFSDRSEPVALAESWGKMRGVTLAPDPTGGSLPTTAAIYYRDYKLLAHRLRHDELFDLASDPGEATDLLAATNPSPEITSLHDRMRRALPDPAETRHGEVPDVSTDAAERMRALGYVN